MIKCYERTYTCENVTYPTAWDSSNKLYKRGSYDCPWCVGPRGHNRAQACVVLPWWKGVDGRDPSSLPAARPRLLYAGTPLGDYTVPPRSKSQYWNNHKAKHLPLKQARVFPPQALLSALPFFFSFSTLTPTRGWKVWWVKATHQTFFFGTFSRILACSCRDICMHLEKTQ